MSGWTCVRCGNYSRTRFGRWWHTYVDWSWRKGTGGQCTRSNAVDRGMRAREVD